VAFTGFRPLIFLDPATRSDKRYRPSWPRYAGLPLFTLSHAVTDLKSDERHAISCWSMYTRHSDYKTGQNNQHRAGLSYCRLIRAVYWESALIRLVKSDPFGDIPAAPGGLAPPTTA
jgi:hypothetical protein